jgi:hypothetical protein
VCAWERRGRERREEKRREEKRREEKRDCKGMILLLLQQVVCRNSNLRRAEEERNQKASRLFLQIVAFWRRQTMKHRTHRIERTKILTYFGQIGPACRLGMRHEW